MKVGGLECARHVSRLSESALCGCSWYMAPEVFEGKTCLKSDVWSLGISLIEMAEGRNPFEGVRILGVIKSVLNKDPPSLQRKELWSSAFVEFVERCLSRDVEKRGSVRELMEVCCGWRE